MTTFLLLAALGVVVLLSASASRASEQTSNSAPQDPIGDWQKKLEATLPPSSNTPALPPPGGTSTHDGSMSDAEAQAWIDFYKKHARTSGVYDSSPMPPEFPSSARDLGTEGDLDRMDEANREEVVYALFYQGDTHTLSLFADEIEANGFPIAANRLRQKALRMVDRVGSPETSPMPMSAES